jgi:hypothetical protein
VEEGSVIETVNANVKKPADFARFESRTKSKNSFVEIEASLDFHGTEFG